MTRTLIVKLLRDVRTPLLVVAVLLFLFQMLWARITRNISGVLLTKVEQKLKQAQEKIQAGLPFPVPVEKLEVDDMIKIFFEDEGQIIQKLIGGEGIDIRKASNLLTTGFVHPLVITILCIWAIGRASGAIAGEIDRGTMELLLAQPISRSRLVLAHLLVDIVTIPVLCLSMWSGLIVVAELVGLVNNPRPELQANPWRFWPSLPNVALLVFAVSGATMWMSAAGRYRNRVLGRAILLALLMFLVNVIGQLLEPLEVFRPFTIFYYYQPQPVLLQPDWYTHREVWGRMAVLLTIGAAGYGLAWWTFTRRDLPAPL
ncbi:MAG: ABC transporter permease [Gemmataceae bacterium]|nr:ABC transporter permease [Gemmataceae bacterium]